MRSPILVQYAAAAGAKVLGVDVGQAKKEFVESLGAQFLDASKSKDIIADVNSITGGGANAVVITSGHPAAFKNVYEMLKVGGSLHIVGIPPGDVLLDIPVASLVIRGIRVGGNLVGSVKEALEAVDLVRAGKVKPHVEVRPFKDLPNVYERLEKGDVPGRIVLQIGKDE